MATGNPFDDLSEKLDRIQADLTRLLADGLIPSKPPVVPRRAYGVGEVAELLGKNVETIRTWCRRGLINAYQNPSYLRGNGHPWVIYSEEIERYRLGGLLNNNPERNKRPASKDG